MDAFCAIKIENDKEFCVLHVQSNTTTGCNRRNGPDFGRVFLMLNYNEKPPKHLYPKLNGLGDNGN